MFKVIKNGLFRDSYIKSLKMESDLYVITFFYEGDYKADMANGRCNRDLFSMHCKIKDEAFTLMDASDEIVLTLPYEPIWRVKDIDEVHRQLDAANAAIAELRKIIKEYFNIDIK